jgi:DNA-binding GntR family transcriptional regulator
MEHLSLKEKAYQIIKEKLLSMEFQPGARIREDLLAEEIAISRTPVREAINKLIAEGFINNIPRRGLFFIKMEKNEILDLLDAREALEVLSVHKCIEKISPVQFRGLEKILDDCEQALRSEKYARCNELDSLFHLEIARISGNKKLIGFCRDIEDFMRIARAVEKETQTKKKFLCALEEHRAILKNIEAKDLAGAEAATRQNITSMRKNLEI